MSALPTLGPSDEELVRRTGAGDARAFEELYRRYAGLLAAYAGRIVRDRAAGEDVAQIALMNAYQALRRGSSPTYARAWLYRIARNAALETIERRADTVALDDVQVGTEDPLDARAARDDLLAAVRTLPERQRKVFVLRELQGLRIGEIAEQLGLATEQVEQALFAARNKLAEHLSFGERLDCASVQSLDAARLSRAERRAVKSHLRSCGACRSSAPRVRVGVLTLPLEWLRQGLTILLGGGGAAKTAAVVTAAAAVGATPVVAHQQLHSKPRAKAAVRAVPAAAVVLPAPGLPDENAAARSFTPRFLGAVAPPVAPPAPRDLRLPASAPVLAATPVAHAPGKPAAAVRAAAPAEPEPAAVEEPEPVREEEPPPVDEPAPIGEEERPPVADEPASDVEPEPVRHEVPVEGEPAPDPVEEVVEVDPKPEPVRKADERVAVEANTTAEP